MKRISIAIDGPAGAGKSTIAKVLSKKLGIIYLDTGSMYRAVALKAINEGVDINDEKALKGLLQNMDLTINFEEDSQHTVLDGKDVSALIRTPEVAIGASNVAVSPDVRIKLVALQREIANQNSVVMDGRDIGTFVLPNATLKIFLTASLDERAKRRYTEQIEKGILGVSLEDVKKDIHYRDENDKSRSFAPLCIAEDALMVDTSGMTLDETNDYILELVKGASKIKDAE